MSTETPIDLSKLPAPEVVETLSFTEIRDAMLADLQARDDTFDALLPSDPAYKILEVAAFREVLIRQRINDAARQVMLAHATGSNLEQLAALFQVTRQVDESDDELRLRVQLAPEGFAAAGPVGAYAFHAHAASAEVKDVDVSSPAPGVVQITVLSTEGDGTPDQDLLDAVEAALDDETVRPLTDTVQVAAAAVTTYAIDVELVLYAGPDDEVVRQAAEDAVAAYCDEHHRLGHDITLAGIIAAAYQPGVQNVAVVTPTEDVVVAPQAAAYCTSVTVSVTGTDE